MNQPIEQPIEQASVHVYNRTIIPDMPEFEYPESPKEFHRLALQYERGEELFMPHKQEVRYTGYEAVHKGNGVFRVGKPIKTWETNHAGDFTESHGGPYDVDAVNNTCTCPQFAGKPGYQDEAGDFHLGSKGYGYCFHLFGLKRALKNVPYRILPKSGRMVWDWTQYVPPIDDRPGSKKVK